MLVFGTQMHLITFVFVVLEFCMFIFQLARFFYRPQDKHRDYYLLLLLLLLFYNITGGLFPDTSLSWPLSIQLIIAYGSGFLMASFFPLFFYKVMDLPALRWHAYYGVPLFLMLPYLIFFVIDYAINRDIDADLKYGLIAPFIYAMVLLYVMFKSIRAKYLLKRNEKEYFEEIAMYLAVSPWAALTLFGVVEASQVTEVFCTNTGIVFITFIFLAQSVTKARHEQLAEVVSGKEVFLPDFDARSRQFKLTKREIEIALLFRKGLTYNEIADILFISVKTVGNHVQNIYDKTGVNNKVALIHKLFE
ncbi:helix-turn-helix transcriptional regulator [Mucilaginibacter rubeus]|uniref:Response regulator transcription factor n=1 Tax=Mucilaginibacter rubeus TaxID=2027860 RepID=A0A5C1HTP3_9SPHI|nr:LuxR C-terminal-related transcriptional regulator [Mucilaginibacter rubeus]QEM09174.1 response regulator transcription factor [Mucilaginibacter rubeus]